MEADHATVGFQIYETVNTTISFPIPLAAGLPLGQVQSNPPGYDGTVEGGTPEEEEQHENCPGTVEEPQAKPGFLCVYTSLAHETKFTNGAPLVEKLSAPEPAELGTASKSGAILRLGSNGEHMLALGSWAVTAE
jgi:hypothetical protein